MTDHRPVQIIAESRPTIEGAGVRLKRAFADNLAHRLDPFLLLDDFHSSDPRDYIAGFPWHPHRGIETVTYMISGSVDHGDSMGNRGTIASGDVQWMTAGGGIVHQEMPQDYSGFFQGFQLWVNLPSRNKMIEPRYRGVTGDEIETATPSKGVRVKVIAGRLGRTAGPVKDLVVEAEYVDVDARPNTEYEHAVKKGNTAFAYVFGGSGAFGPDKNATVGAESLIVFGDGDTVVSRAGKNGLRFLLVSGRPIGEPIAWRGPIVMNTQAELDQAYQEYWNGTFLQHRARLD
jgi:redox-sensitive bicupin YhaK (pirin superfamily)